MDDFIVAEMIDSLMHTDGKPLADGSYVRGSLTIEGDEFTSIPTKLTVFGELNIVNCPNLTELPDNLVVADGLLIQKCPQLRSIGSGVYAGGFMALEECPSLDRIPADLKVDGEIAVCECGDFEPFTPGMNGASTFVTEKFSLKEDQIVFYDPIPETVMVSAEGKKLRAVFDIPMLGSFPQLDRVIKSFRIHDTSGYPTAEFA